MWFDSWESVLRIIVHGSLGYIALVSILRVSGKRTLSKMNAFDFVVTIALGSVFATLLISTSVPLVDGVVAIAVLVALQWIASSLYVRSERFEAIVKGTPELVFWKGAYLDAVLRRLRVSHEEVQAAMRDQNVTTDRSTAVILETDGSLSVVQVPDGEGTDALEKIEPPNVD